MIERIPVSGAAKAETIRIPLHHEEMSVTKRTIVTNEVSVRRKQHVEVRKIEQPVRYEELWLTKEGEVTIHKAPST